jgi:DNA-binding MarR family transcriptional regulator
MTTDAEPAFRDLVDDERLTLMGLLIDVHHQLTRTLGDELEATCGLPLPWYDVLIRLGRSTDGHLTMSRLAAEVSFTSGGITRLVDRIAEAGYVERASCPTDRRAVHVRLTAEGCEVLRRATAQNLEGVQHHLIDRLEPADRAALEAALRKLRGDEPICGSP